MIRFNKGKVIWITGLSGAGKSTLGRELATRVMELGEPVLLLDGDELREIFSASDTRQQNHSRENRLALAMKYARLSLMIASQGLTVVIATISLFREVHVWNRANLPGYFEVYLKVPLEVLRQRDSKGIYEKFDSGKLNNVAGLDLEIDEPEFADLTIEYSPKLNVYDSATALIEKLMEKKLL